MSQFLLSAVALAASAAGPNSPDWRLLTFVDPPAGGVMFVDAASIARSGNMVSFVSDVRFKHPSDGVDRTVQKTEADCSTKRYLDRVVTYYSNGKVLLDEINGEPNRRTAEPGSFYGGVIELVCTDSFSRVPLPDLEAAAARFLSQQ
jgi:hypothetical protein